MKQWVIGNKRQSIHSFASPADTGHLKQELEPCVTEPVSSASCSWGLHLMSCQFPPRYRFWSVAQHSIRSQKNADSIGKARVFMQVCTHCETKTYLGHSEIDSNLRYLQASQVALWWLVLIKAARAHFPQRCSRFTPGAGGRGGEEQKMSCMEWGTSLSTIN